MNNSNNNKGSIIILTVIGIATLLVAVIGATFAFFTVNIRYKDDKPAEVITKSAVLGVIEFNRENDIEYKDLLPGRPGWESQALQIEKNSLKFTVTNKSDSTIRTKYNVYFEIDENDFETNNVVYVLNGTPGISQGDRTDSKGNTLDSEMEKNCNDATEICGNGQYFTNSNYVMHQFEKDASGIKPDRPHKLGFIEAGKTGRVLIGSSTLGAHFASDSWEFELWINEIGGEQNEDQGKTIKGKIVIDLVDPEPVTNEQEYVRNNTTTTTTTVAP